MNYKAYTDYFEKLCEDHPLIKHKENDKISFFTADWEELLSGIRTKIQTDSYIMMLLNYSATIYFKTKDIEITFFILKKFKEGDFEGKRVLQNECELIGQDILLNMNRDSKNHADNDFAKLFYGSFDKIEKVRLIHTRMDIGSEAFVGVQVSLEFKSFFSCKPRVFNPEP